ncbi:fimbrillin family protein [Prevotella sp. AM34-19LB]|jgi:hypothetical protein|uniref:fimbrillin family protein n=1 Tax=Prevotella sp. AM34-19LB TaxID=2292364 RepID=UPI000E5D04E0|nr:fimbrillin family protein [Prevotella sp. AM34-19LB]RHC72870.1 fimbrillin family protein [Prevotella sp. AM34-19LB]
MKKVIFGTALASMALLSACSSDNELANVETTANNAIGFHVVGNKAETRANIIGADNITSTDFNVFAFTRNEDGTDGTIFMGEKANQLGQKGIKIVNKSGEWDYANDADIHYWPANTALNFYAVSPGSFEKVEENMEMTNVYGWNINNNTKTISYSPLDEYAGRTDKKNLDVMYAIAPNQTQTKENGGRVKFQFKHILSQVVFKAKTQLENMEVEINEIKIHNPWTKGTYTLPKTSSEKGTWELTAPTVGSKWGAFTVVTGKKITVTSNGADISVDGPMLFVPQELTAWDVKKTKAEADTEHQVYLEITCKIKQETEYVFGSATEYKTLYVPFGQTWEQGKRYTYTLIFGGGYDDHGLPILQPINFEAVAGNWEEANATDIDVNK